MKRLLPLLVLSFLIISMIPLSLPIAQAAITGPKIIVPGNQGQRSYFTTVAAKSDATHAGFFFPIYPKNPNYYSAVGAIVDNTLTATLNGTVVESDTYEVSVAANSSGFLLAQISQDLDADSAYELVVSYIDNGGIVKDTEMIFDSSASGVRGVVAAWGNDRWLVAGVDLQSSARVLNIFTLNDDLNIIDSTTITLTSSTASGVGLFPYAYYDSINDVFIVLARNETSGNYDLLLLLIPRTNPSNYDTIRLDVNGASEGVYFSSTYKYVIYKNVFMKPIVGDDKVLVVWGYESGNTSITGAIIDISDNTVKMIEISNTGGDVNFYPWIAASSTEWIVIWTYNGALYARFVYPDGTMSSIYTIQGTNAGYATVVYNGYDYTVVYRDYDGTQYNIVGMRITPDGKMSDKTTLVTNTGQRVDIVTVYLSNNDTLVCFENSTASTNSIRVFLFRTEDIPEPALKETVLTVTLSKSTGADAYLNPGETVTVSGYLLERNTGNPVAGQTIEAKLYRYIARTPTGGWNTLEFYASGTATTQADGSYSITITIPSNATDGLYYVSLEFSTNPPYKGITNESDRFLVFTVSPSVPTWATTTLTTGPAILFNNGQVLILDPEGDVRKENLTAAFSDETSDLDIKLLQLAIDNNYLYVKAEFAGDPSLTGDAAPVLGLAFDFTPDVTDDGYGFNQTANFWIAFYDPIGTETHLAVGDGKTSRAWDLTITLGGKLQHGYKSNWIYEDDGKYSAILYIATYVSGSWSWVKIHAGYFEYSGNSIIAAIPLDVIRSYNPHLSTSGLQDILLYAAVFGEDLANEQLIPGDYQPDWGINYANWFDVPGALTANASYTPASYLEQGWNESYRDDYKYYNGKKSWELDTRFVLNINWSVPKFFSYATAYITTVNETYGSDEYSYDFQRYNILAPGTNKYIVRIVDANNSLFNIDVIFGITGVDLDINGSTGTSDDIGFATVSYQLTDETKVGSNDTLTLTATLPTGYSYVLVGLPKNYRVKVLYIATVSWSNVNVNDVNGDGKIGAGDTIHVKGTVTVRKGDDSTGAPVSDVNITIVIWSHSAILGTATASSGTGSFIFDYTFTGSEGIYGTGHNLTVYGDGVTTFITDPVALTYDLTGYFFSLVPAPELPILPIVVLAAVMLLLLIKRRK